MCSRHPAFCDSHCRKQLTRLDSNPNCLSLQFAEAEVSTQGFLLPATAWSPGALGSPPYSTGVWANCQGFGTCLRSDFEALSLPGFSPTLLTLLPALNSFLLLCTFCPFRVARWHLRIAVFYIIYTIYFCPHCYLCNGNDTSSLLEAGILWNQV